MSKLMDSRVLVDSNFN